jgi:hypothetical protein
MFVAVEIRNGKGGVRIWEGRRRGSNGVRGVSESEISSTGSLLCFCAFFATAGFERAVLVTGFVYPVALISFASDFFVFGFGDVRALFILGLPLVCLGDDGSCWLEGGFEGDLEDVCNMALACKEPRAVRLLLSQHLSKSAIIWFLFLTALKRYVAISFASSALV